ncbi:alpha-1,2-fucosyltransferase [Pedobacter sp. V48]|uniref:alpha-1,2-fucosyltransferase n=1 Tax=Pedobacter sp. V48 TaxID=509635 RepID=UPI0003E4AD7E|nr:alpha-1,2-fucosyltransferase [Pedobacter sp. V48]ETZ23860.1 hypothetical protein N824_15090 [Pedobacter sp. V48]
MVIVNLIGGVGNQMFQYCFGRYLSVLTNQELFLNINIYSAGNSDRNYDLDIFRLTKFKDGDAEKALEYLKHSNIPAIHINERFFHYNKDLIKSLQCKLIESFGNQIPHLIISGYWQSEKYFRKIEGLIKEDFTFCNPLYGKWELLNKQIVHSESVMINVRRGDYLQKLDYHGVVDIDYINSAIELMNERVSNPKFFIFSDDILWCKNNIPQIENVIFVDEQYYDPKYQYYLQLMKNCKYFIISNSTFAWWSAWLAPYKNKIVIAPKKWFISKDLNTKDLFPEKWINI